jgi:ABC-type transport system involved in multi-copper enzyme maturation permease subunit
VIWISWRRQRSQLITLLGMLVVGAGVITLLRSNMIDAITSAKLTECVTKAAGKCSAPDGALSAFLRAWDTPLQMAQLLILGLPVLIGVFIGAPLFARELEHGTHVLAFTQSVSRTRWMLSKLLVALAPALIVLVALQYLVSWWVAAAGMLGPLSNGVFNVVNFGTEHVSPAAYALFSFALGTFLGALSRRTLVAMTLGLGAFLVVRFVMSELVSRAVPAQRVEVTPDQQLTVYQDGSLVLRRGWLDASGQPIPADRSWALSEACGTTPQGSMTPEQAAQYLACLSKSGLAKKYADVIPESHVWQVHLADAAIYSVPAVLLLVGTAWTLRRQN